MLALFRFVSGWPLALLHAVGATLGWLGALLSLAIHLRHPG